MSEKSAMAEELRKRILKAPDAILEDTDVMRALAAAGDRARGENVVDMRGIAMDRLEARLDRLEATHQTVISAAYENLSGTNQIHRAILTMMEPTDFVDFVKTLCGEVAHILRVDRARLILESHQDDGSPALSGLDGVMMVGEPGFVRDYVTHGRDISPRQITLRSVHPEESGLYGPNVHIQSEACLIIDLGDERLPGMLALGSCDPDEFSPSQGTDLLSFFASVLELHMRHWLA